MESKPTPKLTRDDRTFLHSMRVDPECSGIETITDAIHQQAYGSANTDSIVVSDGVAKAVVDAYGELNFDTLLRYIDEKEDGA